MTTTTEVACPKCGGRTWDNRETKTNPKAPDYKCRDKGCDGVVWPPKPGQRSPVSQPPAEKQGYSAGPHIPAIDGPVYREETGAPPATYTTPTPARLDAQFAVYDLCLSHAHASAVRLFGKDVTDEAVAAMAATLYIQASK